MNPDEKKSSPGLPRSAAPLRSCRRSRRADAYLAERPSGAGGRAPWPKARRNAMRWVLADACVDAGAPDHDGVCWRTAAGEPKGAGGRRPAPHRGGVIDQRTRNPGAPICVYAENAKLDPAVSLPGPLPYHWERRDACRRARSRVMRFRGDPVLDQERSDGKEARCCDSCRLACGLPVESVCPVTSILTAGQRVGNLGDASWEAAARSPLFQFGAADLEVDRPGLSRSR